MTHLHAASTTSISHRGVDSFKQVDTSSLRETAAACALLLCDSEFTDPRDLQDIKRAVTHGYDVKNRQRFPAPLPGMTAHVLIEGWGFRAQVLPDGSRQITDFIIPGDFCSSSLDNDEITSDIEACGPARIAVLDMDRISDQSRTLIQKIRRRQEADILRRLRAALVSLGRRDAKARLAFLIAECHSRLAGVGLAIDGEFRWPLTQEHLADVLGLTPVHVNRTLARLRTEALLVVQNRTVLILDLVELCRVGGFTNRRQAEARC